MDTMHHSEMHPAEALMSRMTILDPKGVWFAIHMGEGRKGR